MIDAVRRAGERDDVTVVIEERKCVTMLERAQATFRKRGYSRDIELRNFGVRRPRPMRRLLAHTTPFMPIVGFFLIFLTAPVSGSSCADRSGLHKQRANRVQWVWHDSYRRAGV